jgi:hypothetical protein
MHSSVYVFIPATGDLESEVATALAPFDEENAVAGYKVYLTPQEIEAMAKHFHVKPDELTNLSRQMERWRSAPGGVDNRGLFAISHTNPHGRWDWYEFGGRWDNVIPNNVVVAQSLLDRADLAAILPASFVDRNGLWHELETYVASGWPTGHFTTKPESEWLGEFRASLKAAPDSRVVCVDIHY